MLKMNNKIIFIPVCALVMMALIYGVVNFYSCNEDVVSFKCFDLDKFTVFYSDNIRGHVFAGFLALGGFLMSLKTFIIVTMKENLYENERYRAKWEDAKRNDPKTPSLYYPLRQLSDLLYYSIFSSIVAAALQMTIGLINHWVAAAICIYSAIIALLFLIDALLIIKKNLNIWFEYLEDEGNKKSN